MVRSLSMSTKRSLAAFLVCLIILVRFYGKSTFSTNRRDFDVSVIRSTTQMIEDDTYLFRGKHGYHRKGHSSEQSNGIFRSLQSFQSQQTWETKGRSSQDLLLVNAWIGSRMPSYFPQFIANVHRNPSVSFLMISTFDTPEFCPLDGSESQYFPAWNPNVKVHCSDTAALIKKSAVALCREWDCDDRESAQIAKHFNEFVRLDGQAWNNMKPVYASIFADQIYHTFRDRTFTHWMRVDLDLFIGNWAKLFNPEVLLNYDVFTFFPGTSMDWRFIYLKGYVSGFRLSRKVDTLWKTMRMFRSPESFMTHFHISEVLERSLAADEGAQSVNIIRDHPEISFIVEPGLLSVDLDVAADRSTKIVYFGSKHAPDILRVSTSTTEKHLDRLRNEPASESRLGVEEVQTLGLVTATQSCEMNWLMDQDRICLSPPHDTRLRDRLDSGDQIRITRSPHSPHIVASSLPNRRSEIGTGTGLGQMLFYHIQVSKRHGLEYRVAEDGERIEVGKDAESHWCMKRIKSGRERSYKSDAMWPGRWE